MARAFAREGASVYLAGRRQEPLDAVAGEIRANGGAAKVATVDAADELAVEAHAADLVEHAGRIDILFNAIATKDEDGARRQSSADARQGLETRLRREDRTDDEIDAALALFDRAEKGVPFEIGGETFVHGEMRDTFGLPFDGRPVPDAFPSLISTSMPRSRVSAKKRDPTLSNAVPVTHRSHSGRRPRSNARLDEAMRKTLDA